MVTLDTNIAFYALASEGQKSAQAKDALAAAAFLSVQVLNEYANSVHRKLGRRWPDIAVDIELLRQSVRYTRPIEPSANQIALRIAERYQINFYDALMIAVALANGATTLYSEDMHHGLVIDDTLTIINPFRSVETL